MKTFRLIAVHLYSLPYSVGFTYVEVQMKGLQLSMLETRHWTAWPWKINDAFNLGSLPKRLHVWYLFWCFFDRAS